MRVIVADSAPRVRSALKLFIEQCRSDVEILEAKNFDELRRLAERDALDVALIDWHLPKPGGRAALQYLRRVQPDACIIVLSGRPEAQVEAAAADADAFMSKGDPPDSLKAILEQRGSCTDGYAGPSATAGQLAGNRATTPPTLGAQLRARFI